MALEYKVVYSSEAEEDLWHIVAGILEVAWVSSAEKWARRIAEKIDSLAVFPEGGPVYELDDRYRSIKVGKYRIIYRVDKRNGVVRVLRIIYARRDLGKVSLEGAT